MVTTKRISPNDADKQRMRARVDGGVGLAQRVYFDLVQRGLTRPKKKGQKKDVRRYATSYHTALQHPQVPHLANQVTDAAIVNEALNVHALRCRHVLFAKGLQRQGRLFGHKVKVHAHDCRRVRRRAACHFENGGM